MSNIATVYLVWDRKDRKIVGGPFITSQQATDHSKRVRAKNPEAHGPRLLDTVSVTVP